MLKLKKRQTIELKVGGLERVIKSKMFLKSAGSPINVSAKEAVDRKKKLKLWRPLVEPRVRHIQTGTNQIFTAS